MNEPRIRCRCLPSETDIEEKQESQATEREPAKQVNSGRTCGCGGEIYRSGPRDVLHCHQCGRDLD